MAIRKVIRFKCPKCRTEYMGMQHEHKNYPLNRTVWKFCEHCEDILFNRNQHQVAAPDYDFETNTHGFNII